VTFGVEVTYKFLQGSVSSVNNDADNCIRLMGLN